MDRKKSSHSLQESISLSSKNNSLQSTHPKKSFDKVLTSLDMENLWEQHQRVIYYSLAHLGIFKSHGDFEDFVQDGFLKLCDLAQRFKGDWLLENRYQFISYAKISLRRFYLDLLHRKSYRKDDKNDPALLDLLADEKQNDLAENLLIRDCLAQIRPEDCQLFLALYHGGKSKEDLAQQFGLSRRTLYRRIDRIKIALAPLFNR
ncbi:sigma-70 family RNA polymerase sigma factor [Atopobacter sp. AH10]|uniref:sigma-70 family RNA polymerase sigma factor n=1 Tax=Atopobacter sp. AH10 TaxID=2315861 RepID=UPI000EF1E9E7|nr:sigma-70 family RNA polymerase sigma factor [Atopobacter sp. AH10]RLK63302.1 sigma-70 family RNA polymerase sigma factor [Atopobacter sp. AH10]